MRIAVYHNLPSGGAKRTLNEAVRRLAARHPIDAYTLTCAEHEFADIRPWVSRHREYAFEPLPLLKSPFGRFNQVLRMADLGRVSGVARQVAGDIDRAGYDVALVHPCRFEQSPSVLRFLERTPSVYYCHESQRLAHEAPPPRPYDDAAIRRRRILNRLDPFPALYRRRLCNVDRNNTRSAGTVLVNSRFTARTVAGIYGIDAQVSYHGVDAQWFKPLGMDKRRAVLSVGSLTPLKGFDFLIRMMSNYRAENRPALIIASNFQNPPERAYLERLAGELGVELVLMGNVSERDLVQLYNQALAVVYAPVREPFGLVPLESMSCATPVVAVAEGGISESVVHGETGLLVERDPKLFARALREVVENPTLARQYGCNGREHVLKNWTWERAVDALEQCLQNAVRRAGCVQGPLPALAR
jgi:glycosyltransferase involved in cell wall biosynthesis